MRGNGTFWRDLFPIGLWSIPVLLGLGGCGFLFGFYAPNGGTPVWRALEAATLTMLGAVLARGFISLLLNLAPGRDSVYASTGTAYIFFGFFLSPLAVIEIVVLLCGRRFFSSPTGLLLTATVVGAFAGMMDGGYQIHRLSGLFPFPFDVTWGLSGTTNGCFLHLFDAGNHEWNPRHDSHQYNPGFFYIEKTATFTEGSVMSNFFPSVFSHELLHTYQNRFWGPLYTFSYLLWTLIALVPGLVVGLVIGDGAGGIRAWSYANNPHEALAYQLAGAPGETPPLLWTTPIWLPVSLILYLHLVFFLLRLGSRVWVEHDQFRAWNVLEIVRGTWPALMAAANLTIFLAWLGTTAGWALGGTLAVIAALSCLLPVLGDAFAANPAARIYKVLLGWLSLATPLCWPANAIGLLAFLINLIGIRAIRFDWRTANLRAIGGVLAQLPAHGFTIGHFSFINSERLTESTMLHESGHALNHAAYGFLHLLHFIRPDGRASLWERIAESHVPPGLRRTDSYDQSDDWPRLRMWGPGATTH